MAIRFGEIKKYLARNVRLSLYKLDDHYDDYLMVSDIPDDRYDDLYVYGVGLIDVEFSMDVFTEPKERVDTKDIDLKPAVEIVLTEEPRDIKREVQNHLLFKDLKPYLQQFRNFTLRNREDWKGYECEYREEIPQKYDEMYVYGIGMENNYSKDELTKRRDINHDTVLKKRMLIVLSEEPREDIVVE